MSATESPLTRTGVWPCVDPTGARTTTDVADASATVPTITTVTVAARRAAAGAMARTERQNLLSMTGRSTR